MRELNEKERQKIFNHFIDSHNLALLEDDFHQIEYAMEESNSGLVIPKIAEENFLRLFTGKIVKKERGRFGTIHYSFIWDNGDYQKRQTFDSEIDALKWLYKSNFSA